MKEYIVNEEKLFKDPFLMLDRGFGRYVTENGDFVGEIRKGNKNSKGEPIFDVIYKYTAKYYEKHDYPIPESIKDMHEIERIVRANPHFGGRKFVLVGASNCFPETNTLSWYTYKQLCGFLSRKKKIKSLPLESDIDLEPEMLFAYQDRNGIWTISPDSADIISVRKKDELIKE